MREGHVLELDLAHRELLPPPDYNLVLTRIDPQDEPRPRLGEVAEAAALADGVERRAPVRAELAATPVDHAPGANRQPLGEIARGLAAGHKADLLALGLVGDRKTELARVLADLALGHGAERKQDAGQPLRVEVVQHVGLVLCRIDRGVQLRSLRSLHDAGVVPGGQPVEAELDHARQHQVEAHEGVASHAGVRSATLEVIAVEGLDDSLAEFLLEVPAVIRNA